MFIRLLILPVTLISFFSSAFANDVKYIFPIAETPQVPLDGNADDPAIWLDKEDSKLSLVFGTDKYRGIYTYNLKGNIIGFSESGRVNNIDLRSLYTDTSNYKTFIFGSNGTKNTLDLWVYANEEIHQGSLKNDFSLSEKPHISVLTNFLSYGVCAGYDKDLGLIAFVTEAKGSRVQVWQYADDELTLIHTFNNGDAYESEGCVYDDENRTLFISEENDRGVIRAYKITNELRFNNPAVIDTREGNIIGDPEGLAILNTDNKNGYLIASSQGSSTFNIYDRNAPYSFIDKFSVNANGSFDAVSDTDGIDIINTYLNEDFPSGMIVVQDGHNTGEEEISKENFKYLSLKDLVAELGL